MEILPDLDRLTDEEKADLIARLEAEEGTTSVRRRVLHVRIDYLRKEYEERVKARIAEGQELPILEPKDLDRPLFEGTGDLPEEHDLGPLPELASLSDAALRDLIHELEVEEDDVSFHRRVASGTPRHRALLHAGRPARRGLARKDALVGSSWRQ